MDTGSFIAFNIAFANLMAAVLEVGYTSIGLLELLPRYERLRPILEEKPEFAAAVLEPVRLMGALALNHVSFRYPTQEKGAKVLDNVSLQVRPGEFVAIVGPSGSGKSTLMRLLLGFESPDSGTVTYDGRELATLDPREVRRQIGVVLQHSELMPSDIFNNIVGFAPFLTMDDAWRAARMAGLEDDIRRMPMGMYTLVGEGGGNLSSGQKQRLLIARAIVRGPKILLFDEATSALDNVTQVDHQRQPHQPAQRGHAGRHRPPARCDRQRRSHLRRQGWPHRPVGSVPTAHGRTRPVPRPGPAPDSMIVASVTSPTAFFRPEITKFERENKKNGQKTKAKTREKVRAVDVRRRSIARPTLPKVDEATSYGTPAFKVAGKLFARLHQDGESLVVKIDPGERVMRMKAEPETFYITDHYLNYPWILVRIATVDRADLRDLLEDAWR